MIIDHVVVNEVGNWDNKLWTPELKKELNEEGTRNTIVGQTLIEENNKYKLWSIHLLPGQRLSFHKHCKPYFWVIVNEGKALSYYHSGQILQMNYKINDTRNFTDLSEDNFFIHDLKNIGDTVLVFTTVEFK